MKRRLKRFNMKPESQSNLALRLSLNDGSTIEAPVNCVSLQSVGIEVDKSLAATYLDSSATAELLTDHGIFDLGKVYLLKTQPMNHDNAKGDRVIMIIKTLSNNIPVENLMRYVANPQDKSPYDFELSHGKFTLLNFYEHAGADDLLEKADLFLTMQDSWRTKEVYQFERFRFPSKGKRVTLDRVRPSGSNEYLVFGSNDYLGLACHPQVVAKAQEALATYGLGSTGSPLTTGQSLEHINLQKDIAEIFRKEACLLYNSGYTANIGILSALCKKNDLVLYDNLCHASIADGIKMAFGDSAVCKPFKHNDMTDLEALLSQHRGSHSGCLIVTEGIFSMDGHIAPMDKIVTLATKYFCRTFLDVAHDFGVVGENGLGAAEFCGVLDRVDIIMGTFSKIGGGIGGFCVGQRSTIEYLRYMSRSFMFSVSLPPCNVAGAREAIRIFWEDKSHLQKLKANIRYFVNGLRHLGVQIAADHQSSICPVVIGDEERLGRMTQILLDQGVYVTPIVFPAVSRSQARFRFTVSAAHDQSDLDYALLVLKMAIDAVGADKIGIASPHKRVA
jgi:8-amino-7-oxononanoate synthase